MSNFNLNVKTAEANTAEATAAATLDGMVITDADGRQLTLREIDFLDHSRLVRALGGEAARNAIYMNGYVLPAVSVAAINGDECLMPQSVREVDAAIKRLGREGVAAVLAVMIARHEDSAEEGAALKNS